MRSLRTTLGFVQRRLTPAVVCVALITSVGCQDLRDTVNNKLYKPVTDTGWETDSTFLANSPSVLFRIYHRAGKSFVMPIGALGPSGMRDLHMTQRGWRALDINLLYAGNKLLPVRNGQVAGTIATDRGMWEDPTHPVDSVKGCPTVIPTAQVNADSGLTLALTNYKAPGGQLLDAGALANAISEVPQLVAPTMGISGAELSHYERFVHQIAHAEGPPSILLEYHDLTPVVDTGVTQGVRPKHLIIVLDKGIYGYRATWRYQTTGMSKDKPALHYLDAVDTNADGIPELFFSIDYVGGRTQTSMYKQWNDSWRESWLRDLMRCDLSQN